MTPERIAYALALAIVVMVTLILSWAAVAFVTTEPDPFVWNAGLRLMVVGIVMITISKFVTAQEGK